VLDPNTGEATPVRSYGHSIRDEQYRDPVLLTSTEKRLLGSDDADMVGVAAATDVRPGDRVAQRDLDKKATSGQPVTVTWTHSSPYQSKTHINYLDTEGNPREADVAKDAEIRVVDRARASLNVQELAQLRCGMRADQ